MIGPYNAPWFKVKSIENPELVGWVYGAFIAPLMKGAYPWNEDETTRVINGQISGPMNVITEYNAARGWQSDDAIRIPRGEGPQIGYDINHTRGTVLVFKNIPLSPYLMGAELIATDPLGNEFIHNFQPDEDDYIYEDVYNSQKLDIPAFILAFSPINNSKTGLWHFI